ncbi:hypothetical protein DFP73DRAFT_565887 [Morchella snyderi]|nr:hypothetical protein DFP73DRAFT_565887 [Morchella snyderi]
MNFNVTCNLWILSCLFVSGTTGSSTSLTAQPLFLQRYTRVRTCTRYVLLLHTCNPREEGDGYHHPVNSGLCTFTLTRLCFFFFFLNTHMS